MHVLIATPDLSYGRFLERALRAQGYTVDLAAEPLDATHLAGAVAWDLIIVDSSPPKLDGAELVQRLRATNGSPNILLLTEGRHPQDRARGLDMGADDCVSKPCSLCELVARVRAVVRRRGPPLGPVLRVEDLELSWALMTVRRAQRRIALTPKEFSLLAYLMQNAGRPVTRAMILDSVWGLGHDPQGNVVDVYVYYLRRKVDSGFAKRLIQTVPGVGYRLGGERGG